MGTKRSITRRRTLIAAGTVLGAAASGLPGRAAAAERPDAAHADGTASGGDVRNGWVGSWGASPCSGSTELGSAALTVRNVVHTSLGGPQIRIRMTNAFGSSPLTLTQVTAALPVSPSSAQAQPGTMSKVTFGGEDTVMIPAGAETISDPVRLAVPAESDLLVSVGVAANSGPATFHLHATQVNYVAAGGDHAADISASAFTKTTASWFYISEVDVRAPEALGTVVTLGDSITDGVTSTVGADHRWPDYLARRLLELPAGLRCGVVNAGISGNRILLDGSALASAYAAAGQSAVARLQRDVLARTGVRTLIVFEGINDIVWEPNQLDPRAIIGGLEQIISQAHAVGVRVVGATITPAGGYAGGFDAQQEATREAVNAWIRGSQMFDAIADFDAVLRDPADPEQIAPQYDSGDHLHPTDAGYQALADSLKLTARFDRFIPRAQALGRRTGRGCTASRTNGQRRRQRCAGDGRP
jgi:lysophospholipase L1-like esterase